MKVLDEAMLGFAMRYCLGRKSHAPIICQMWIKENWGAIKHRDLLIRDLEREFQKPGCYSDEETLDESWKGFLKWMVTNEYVK